MKTQTWLFLAGLAALLFHSCAPAKPLTFDGAFRPGDRLHYRLTENTETRTETARIGEETVPPSMTTEDKVLDYVYTVRAVRPDRSVDLEMTITQLRKVETDAEGVKEYDSTNPDLDTTDLTNRVLGLLIGTPFQFTLSPSGQVGSFRGMDAVWDKIESEASKDSPLAGNMLKNMKTQLGDETMGNQQNDIWGHIPAGKVRVGQQWKRNANLPAFGINGTVRYTLREHNGRNARITFTSAYSTDKAKPGILDMGMIKIRYNLTGTGSGTILTDLPAALPRRVEQKLTMGGPMELKVSFMDWTKVPVNIQLTSVLERVD